jgi:hypothetical protein
MAVHRHCKQRVDRIMASATDPNRSPLVLRSDSKVLVEEIEDVRAERDELLKRVGNMVDAWDEAMIGSYGQPLTACMEQLRDMLPFPWPEAKRRGNRRDLRPTTEGLTDWTVE